MDCSPPVSLTMDFSRQEYWSGLPFPSPGDLPNLEMEPESPALQSYSLPSEPPGKLRWSPAVRETWVQSLGWEDPLEEGMATHSSILGWRRPWSEEPGGVQHMGSQRDGHNWAIVVSVSVNSSHRPCATHILLPPSYLPALWALNSESPPLWGSPRLSPHQVGSGAPSSPECCASFCDSAPHTSLDLFKPHKSHSFRVGVQRNQHLFQHKRGVWGCCWTAWSPWSPE